MLLKTMPLGIPRHLFEIPEKSQGKRKREKKSGYEGKREK